MSTKTGADSGMSSEDSDSGGSDVPFLLDSDSHPEPGRPIHASASELLQTDRLNYVVWMFKTPERLWSTALSVAVVSTLSLLGGFTLGFASSTLLDLGDLPEEYRFDHVLSDLFGVSQCRVLASLAANYSYIPNYYPPRDRLQYLGRQSLGG